MGAVYEVEHEITKHRRALKLLHPQYADVPSVITRFLREASAAGRIGSQHIVETFDAGQLDSGEPYIVMEMLDGEPLSDRLERTQCLGYDEAIEIMRQTCDGVGAAHEAGIIHRDLKPENLFLVRGERLFVKLLDFGISKFDAALTGAGEALTQDGAAMGTPYYMSPEQVSGRADLDARTDVYALGVVLYECVTGAKPFVADTMMQLSVLIHQGKYTPPDQLRPGIPPDLAVVIQRAMAYRAEQRYSSVSELSEALAAVDLSSVGRVVVMSGLGADDALGHTMPLGGETAGAVQAGTNAVDARSLAGTANTVAGSAEVGGEAAAERGSAGNRRTMLLVAAGAVVLTVVGIGALLSRSSDVDGDEPEVDPASIQSEAARRPGADPAPAVALAVAPPSAPPSATASGEAAEPAASAPEAAAGAAEPSRAAARARAKAPPPAQATPPTRAKEHGLAEENPF